MTSALLLIAALSLAGQNSVVIDGRFAEWPVTKMEPGWVITGQSRADALNILVQHPGPPRVLQQLDNPIRLGFDLDDDATTGAREGVITGCELAFTFSPPRGSRGGMGVSAATWSPGGSESEASPYDYGFMFAPTTASRRHEIHVDRASLSTRAGAVRAILSATDGTAAECVVALKSTPADTPATAPLPKRPRGTTRLASWNIKRGGLLTRSDLCIPMLKAIDADVLLIQELQDEQTPEDVKRILEDISPGTSWTVTMSARGSGLRTAVASRLPAEELVAFRKVTRSDDPARTIRASGLVVTLPDGVPMLAIAIHLKCCGGLNGPEDMKRISEILSIREAIQRATELIPGAGLAIGGDFNLVGSPVPLDILRQDGQALLGSDHAGDLIVAEARQIDGRSTVTWYDADSMFTPGRLDYVLVGGAVHPMNAFVLDTSDLEKREQRQLGLQADLANRASDHLPVVVDLRTSPPKRSTSSLQQGRRPAGR